MNNKPVAWLIQTKTAHQFTFKEPKTIPIDAVVEPLYTHPVDAVNTSQKCVDKTQNNRHDLTDEVKDALKDALSGWKYIRHSHGDLYGIGWDRVQDKLEAILRKAQEQ